MELHLGTKPARPTRLLVASAVLLCAVLVLAQAQAVLRLQRTVDLAHTPTPIYGSPLTVRLPKNTLEDPGNPRSYILPQPGVTAPHSGAVVGRRIRFIYDHRPGYVPLNRLAQELGRSASAATIMTDAVKVGALPAIDVLTEFRGERRLEVVVYRLACSPLGDVIGVEYTPLSEWTPAEQRVLDAICATVSLGAGASNSATPEQLQQRAALHVTPPAQGRLISPQFAEAPGFYVTGDPAEPAWLVGFVRAVIPDPESLQPQFSEISFRLWGTELAAAPTPVTLPTQLQGYWLRPAKDNTAVHSAALVLNPATNDAAWVFTSGEAQAAESAAQALIASLRFDAHPLFSNLAPVSAEAAKLVQALETTGPSPWWRAASSLRFLRIQAGQRTGNGVALRAALAGGRAGYQGKETILYDDSVEQLQTVWELSGAAFDYQLAQEETTRFATQSVIVRDERRDGEDLVRRSVRDGRQPRVSHSIPVDEHFVPRPLEEVFEQAAAMTDNAAYRIDVLDGDHPRTLPRLVWNIPPDAEGRRRAFLLDASEPWGVVLTFDSSGEWSSQRSAGLWIQVVPRATGEAGSARWREFLRHEGLLSR